MSSTVHLSRIARSLPTVAGRRSAVRSPLHPIDTPSRLQLYTSRSIHRFQISHIANRRPSPQILDGRCTPVHFQRWQSGGGSSMGGASDYRLGPTNDVQPAANTQKFGPNHDCGDHDCEDGQGKGKDGGEDKKKEDWRNTSFKMFESAATTAASIAILGFAGYAYHRYYKDLVLRKIHKAFEPGHDPALLLSAAGHVKDKLWVRQDEQDHLNRIIGGEETGHYYLLIGEKGTGKSSMLLDAMRGVDGDNCSMLEAHADAEIFRSRLGKALDFEYHEDYIGSLFSIRGPRETSPILDIERAFNKLEKVALQHKSRDKRPLILIINSMHLLRDDDEGRDMLELLQQRAEAWAAQKLVTMIFNSDDYWVYERLKQYSSRMEVISISDLPRDQVKAALRTYRKRHERSKNRAFDEESITDELADEIYKQVGGRLAFLNRVAKSKNMLEACREIIDQEKTWLLNQCGLLGSDMDDDVMNQQKYASAAMVLVRYLVNLKKENVEKHGDDYTFKLPEVPLYKARQVMTRAEFIQQYDHMNIFTIDSKCNVRADSVPMQNAFEEVVAEEGFDQYLEDTLQRIADIESLGRTREITIKDLWNGGKYNMTVKDRKGNVEKVISFDVEEGKKDDDDS